MSLNNARHLSIGGKDVVRLDIGGGVVWVGLPSGFKRLEYIEVTGSQYINPDFIANQDSRFVCELMLTPSSGMQSIYGARQTASSATNASKNFTLRAVSGKWQPCYGSVLGGTGVPTDNDWHIADQNRNVFTLDGIEVADGTELTDGTTVADGVLTKVFDEQTFTTPKSFLIGAINSAASGGNIYYCKARFRWCMLYDNAVLVRYLIPCEDADGNIGMYDVINARFHGNEGTGEFVAGPELLLAS